VPTHILIWAGVLTVANVLLAPCGRRLESRGLQAVPALRFPSEAACSRALRYLRSLRIRIPMPGPPRSCIVNDIRADSTERSLLSLLAAEGYSEVAL